MSKEKESSYEELIAEIKEIRKLLTPPPVPEPKEKPKGFKNRVKALGFDFVDFLKAYKVLGIAIAFIMAVYVGAVVNSLVGDIIFPLLEYLPGFDAESATWMDWPFGVKIRLGAFLSSIVTFIIVALVIFLIVKLSKKIGLD